VTISRYKDLLHQVTAYRFNNVSSTGTYVYCIHYTLYRTKLF